ncbi:hypothetical protein [Parendozoicomonas haliclonae]|nr:hypothetical protein [Parendozoicomonas haliclonae]
MKTVKAVVITILTTALTITMLQGCSEQDKKSKTVASQKAAEQQGDVVEQVTIEDILPESATTSYNCDDSSGMTADKRFWCLGLKAWSQSEHFDEGSSARDEFINAWKLGALDAQQARDPAIENLQTRPLAAAGYESGYVSVLDAIGIVEYECSEGEETDNEYRDRWCEAANAYNSSRLGSPANAVLRGTYINGYMSGRAIALTLPTSMESLFGGESTPQEGAKKAIDEPDSDTPKSIQVFYRGFNDGFQAMIDTVRESVNQVMEQMQGMPGMDGMPPGMEGMPGMDGMMPPPGMMDPMAPPMPGQ